MFAHVIVNIRARVDQRRPSTDLEHERAVAALYIPTLNSFDPVGSEDP
jgi:hypothetical protein